MDINHYQNFYRDLIRVFLTFTPLFCFFGEFHPPTAWRHGRLNLFGRHGNSCTTFEGGTAHNVKCRTTFSSRRKSSSRNDEYVSLVPIPLIRNASRPVGLHSVVNVMEAWRLITATSSCFASVGPLFPFLPRGFPARWHLGMSECRHALAQPPRHPTPPHQHSAALSSQSLSFPG